MPSRSAVHCSPSSTISSSSSSKSVQYLSRLYISLFLPKIELNPRFVQGMNIAKDGWYTELGSMWPGQGLSLKVKEVLYRARSDFQVKLGSVSGVWCLAPAYWTASSYDLQQTQQPEAAAVQQAHQHLQLHQPNWIHVEIPTAATLQKQKQKTDSYPKRGMWPGARVLLSRTNTMHHA